MNRIYLIHPIPQKQKTTTKNQQNQPHFHQKNAQNHPPIPNSDPILYSFLHPELQEFTLDISLLAFLSGEGLNTIHQRLNTTQQISRHLIHK